MDVITLDDPGINRDRRVSSTVRSQGVTPGAFPMRVRADTVSRKLLLILLSITLELQRPDVNSTQVEPRQIQQLAADRPRLAVSSDAAATAHNILALAVGTVTATPNDATRDSVRVGLGSGVFSQGASRQIEFGPIVNF
jgi:hypothetical protein